jgi:hypothetical protein
LHLKVHRVLLQRECLPVGPNKGATPERVGFFVNMPQLKKHQLTAV